MTIFIALAKFLLIEYKLGYVNRCMGFVSPESYCSRSTYLFSHMLHGNVIHPFLVS